MSAITNIVKVTITKETARISVTNFGQALILASSVPSGFSGLVKLYSDTKSMLTDGFLTTDDAYIAANAFFSQNPSVEAVKIGKRGSQVAMVQDLVFSGSLVSGNSIAGKIGGVAITPVVYATSNAATLTALATEIALSPLVATAVSDGVNKITVTAQTAGVPATASAFLVTLGASQPTVSITTTTANVGVQEDIAAIIDEDDNWYGLILTERTQSVVELASSYIQALRKIFVTSSDDVDILDDTVTTDIASVINDGGFGRTAVLYHTEPEKFPDAAWMGRLFPYNPGSETWMFKSLAGIKIDKFTNNEIANARLKNANLYYLGSIDGMTANGTMGGGEFIDTVRAIDWLQTEIENQVFDLLLRKLKVPYTDGGATSVQGQIRKALELAVDREVLDDDENLYTSAIPVKATSSIDRENRVYRGFKFGGRLQGAIHEIIIDGTLTV